VTDESGFSADAGDAMLTAGIDKLFYARNHHAPQAKNDSMSGTEPTLPRLPNFDRRRLTGKLSI
jgi:hypothetical protein